MSLFGKKDKKEIPTLPRLPELPSLPNLPSLDNYDRQEDIHQLPAFPTSALGERFSQNTIKNAVMGDEDAEFEMQEPEFLDAPLEKIKGSVTRSQLEQGTPLAQKAMENFSKPKTVSIEPVFIRLDKFEDALKIFEDTKEKISEIEELLKETKELKEKEEKELSLWTTEIQNIKEQIEEVDKDIFSKI
jgi:hypothetical protein